MSKKIMQFCAIVAIITGSVFLGACTPVDPADGPSKPAATPTSQVANSPASTYYGAIDYRDCEVVKGWVFNTANPTEDINVALYVDDKLIETVPAKTLRPDVKARNHGTGKYGYSFTIPSKFKDGVPHKVNAKTVGSDYTLINIPNMSPFQCPPK